MKDRKDYTMTPDEVRRIRLKLGLSAENFATALGMGLSTVKRYEMGYYPLHVVARLLRVIDAHPEVLRYFLEDDRRET